MGGNVPSDCTGDEIDTKPRIIPGTINYVSLEAAIKIDDKPKRLDAIFDIALAATPDALPSPITLPRSGIKQVLKAIDELDKHIAQINVILSEADKIRAQNSENLSPLEKTARENLATIWNAFELNTISGHKNLLPWAIDKNKLASQIEARLNEKFLVKKEDGNTESIKRMAPVSMAMKYKATVAASVLSWHSTVFSSKNLEQIRAVTTILEASAVLSSYAPIPEQVILRALDTKVDRDELGRRIVSLEKIIKNNRDTLSANPNLTDKISKEFESIFQRTDDVTKIRIVCILGKFPGQTPLEVLSKIVNDTNVCETSDRAIKKATRILAIRAMECPEKIIPVLKQYEKRFDVPMGPKYDLIAATATNGVGELPCASPEAMATIVRHSFRPELGRHGGKKIARLVEKHEIKSFEQLAKRVIEKMGTNDHFLRNARGAMVLRTLNTLSISSDRKTLNKGIAPITH